MNVSIFKIFVVILLVCVGLLNGEHHQHNSNHKYEVIIGHKSIPTTTTTREPVVKGHTTDDDDDDEEKKQPAQPQIDWRDKYKDNYQMMPMTLSNGTKYECYIPLPNKRDDESWAPIPTASEFASLLEPLNSKCMNKPAGWWTYEYCHNQHVSQFHTEKGKVTAEFKLGLPTSNKPGQIKGIDAAFEKQYNEYGVNRQFQTSNSNKNIPKQKSIENGILPYYVEYYENGTPCDLYNGQRQTEVRFICPKDYSKSSQSLTFLQEVAEPTSCSYVITIQTNLMCLHPLFRPKPNPNLEIECIIVQE